MKHQIKLMAVGIFLALQISSYGQTLTENLKILEPMLGKNWVGEMKSPDGKTSSTVSLSYEPIWNGEVVKFSRSNPGMKSFLEGYFYWDEDEKKIVFFSVSNRGGAMKADVSLEDGKITLKGDLTIQNKTFQYRNVFEFTSDGKMIDRWFQNASGTWRPGHVVEFVKTDKTQSKGEK
jgi:hypothetical protein